MEDSTHPDSCLVAIGARAYPPRQCLRLSSGRRSAVERKSDAGIENWRACVKGLGPTVGAILHSAITASARATACAPNATDGTLAFRGHCRVAAVRRWPVEAAGKEKQSREQSSH